MIRMATRADAAAILAIYAPYIRETSLTFETVVPSVADFAARIDHYLDHFPWLVKEENGEITGYAYASRYRERVAYQWSVESSVYIRDDQQRTGLGKQLYQKLLAILKAQGFNTVYAVINLPNEPSVSFHERLGFTYLCTYDQVGYKLGQWKNVGWWQYRLNSFVHEPPAPTPLPAMEPTHISSILSTND